MAEESKTTNVHDDLEDLLREVADAHLPGYSGAPDQAKQAAEQNGNEEGLTAA